MKNTYFLHKSSLLRYYFPVFIALCSSQLEAQKTSTIIFEKPSELKADTLSLDMKDGQLSKIFNFKNESGIRKSGEQVQVWEYDNDKFAAICKNEESENFNEDYEGELPFNKELDLLEIVVNPNFSNNKLSKIQFKAKGNKGLVYDGTCKYPYLTVDDAPVKLELSDVTDSIVKRAVEIKNIGYEVLNLRISTVNNEILSIDTTFTVPPSGSTNINLLFAYPKLGNEKTNVENDTIKKTVTLHFINKDFPKNNTVKKEFAVTLVKIGTGYTYLYLLFLLIPVFLMLMYLFYRKSFIAYRNHLDKFYSEHEDENHTAVIVDSLNKFIPEHKILSRRKQQYYVEKTIVFTQGKILLEDFSNLFGEIKNEDNKRDITTLFISQQDAYLNHFRPNKNAEVNTNIKEVFKTILKDFLNASLAKISNGVENNKFSQHMLDTAFTEGVTQITDAIAQENKGKHLAVGLIEKVRLNINPISDEEAIKLLANTFDICDDFKNRMIITKLQNGISVPDCIALLEEDSSLIMRIKSIINYSGFDKNIDDAVGEIFENNQQLKQQLLNLPDEKLFIMVLNRIFKIIDAIKNDNGWNDTFKNVFFRSLRDEDSNVRQFLSENSGHENAFVENKIPLEKLKYTLSELFRIYAFNKVEASYVKNNFTQVHFPSQKYQACILILKGLILNIYDVEVIVPELFEDIFNSEIHKKGEGASVVMRGAPNEVFDGIKDQTIIDFDTVVFKLSTSKIDEKIKVFTR